MSQPVSDWNRSGASNISSNTSPKPFNKKDRSSNLFDGGIEKELEQAPQIIERRHIDPLSSVLNETQQELTPQEGLFGAHTVPDTPQPFAVPAPTPQQKETRLREETDTPVYNSGSYGKTETSPFVSKLPRVELEPPPEESSKTKK